jgi:hypothetical protein
MNIVLTVNCNGSPVYAYEIGDMVIYNPNMSECGRFAVDPLIAYGITQEQVTALHSLNAEHNYNDSL